MRIVDVVPYEVAGEWLRRRWGSGGGCLWDAERENRPILSSSLYPANPFTEGSEPCHSVDPIRMLCENSIFTPTIQLTARKTAIQSLPFDVYGHN